MAVERVLLDGRPTVTLKELLRPNLKAVIVGINPARVSVQRGHYYQGQHGRQMWMLLREWKIATTRTGIEDDDAFAQGFGFADLIRRPTKSADELSHSEKKAAVVDLVRRVEEWAGRPIIIFRYKKVQTLAEAAFRNRGYRTGVLPSPYEPKEMRNHMMRELKDALGEKEQRNEH